ncbi:MAG TPA: PadR family transcriptional regulator [Actinomycetota bacterium]|nr:PadR family transcriptional regulator [Actinomycetota bacterium]
MALPTTSHVVLGMLSFGPMSGYELTQFVAKSVANFWPISKSQVYGELARLAELGLVKSTAVEQEKLPDKRTYELTGQGEQALDEWLSSPKMEADRQRSEFLVRIFFGHRLSRLQLLDLLDRYAQGAAQCRQELQAVVESLGQSPHSQYARATALLGVRVAEAVVAWAEEIRPELEKSRARRGARR